MIVVLSQPRGSVRVEETMYFCAAFSDSVPGSP